MANKQFVEVEDYFGNTLEVIEMNIDMTTHAMRNKLDELITEYGFSFADEENYRPNEITFRVQSNLEVVSKETVSLLSSEVNSLNVW